MTSHEAVARLILMEIRGSSPEMRQWWAGCLDQLPTVRKAEAIHTILNICTDCLTNCLFNGVVPDHLPLGFKLWVVWCISDTEQDPVLN